MNKGLLTPIVTGISAAILLWHLVQLPGLPTGISAGLGVMYPSAFSYNPITNVVTMAVIVPEAELKNMTTYAGLMAGQDRRKAAFLFGGESVEDHLRNQAREKFDLYAIALPYTVRLTFETKP